MMSLPGVRLALPCFNEARRLDVDAIAALSRTVRVVAVDDGSTDATADMLRALAARADASVDVVTLDVNRGKGEAVRRGMLRALELGASVTGYLDADLSTPPDEIERLVRLLLARPDVDAVLGSRVATLGRSIERRALRHYLGRVFATGASLALGVAVYDTQCGAKVLRNTDALARALAAPFTSRWAFDVELLARLLDDTPPHRLLEVPLERWRDIGGSKLSLAHMALAGVDLARIAAAHRRR